MKALVAALSLFALSSPAFAQGGVRSAGADRGADVGPGDTRQSGDTDANGDRLVCRSMSSSSTTRMAARRVCHTAAEWRQISRQTRD